MIYNCVSMYNMDNIYLFNHTCYSMPCRHFKCYSINGIPQIHVSHVSTGGHTQLASSCVSAYLATNVDLFACFAERLFKSSSISYILMTNQPRCLNVLKFNITKRFSLNQSSLFMSDYFINNFSNSNYFEYSISIF